MEWHRVKSIIIVILLMINGFLLVLVGARHGEAMRYEQSALERTVQVLNENDITLSDTAIRGHTGYTPEVAERSAALEMALAAALLGGEVTQSDLGGGLYSYEAPAGTVNFRSGGEFSLLPGEDPVWCTNDPMIHSTGLMDAIKTEYRLMDAQVSGGTGEIVYRQLLNGASVFSCQVIFAYEDGQLTGLSGTLLVVEERRPEDSQALTLPTVLMSFLDEVLSSGDVCSAIFTVEPGYLLSQSFSNAVHLRPVWYISTNTADYYVDGISGELTRI